MMLVIYLQRLRLERTWVLHASQGLREIASIDAFVDDAERAAVVGGVGREEGEGKGGGKREGEGAATS